MVSTNKSKEKASSSRQKATTENNNQMVLLRDESSQELMVVDTHKVSSLNKKAKIASGVKVTYEDELKKRSRGLVLIIGNEGECLQMKQTVEGNADKENSDVSEPEDASPEASQSTIEPKTSEKVNEKPKDNEDAYADERQKQQQQLDKDELDDSLISSQIIDQENDGSTLAATTNQSNSSNNERGKKRTHDDSDENVQHRKRRLNGSTMVSFSTYASKEKECVALQAQIAKYEQEWMPRPKDPKVIQYLIEITNILNQNKNNEEEDLGDALENIMGHLEINEHDLQLCHGRSATVTARHIMKFKYPNPDDNCTIRNIGEAVIQAIIKYTRISNATDQCSDADIRHAIGNYLAVQRFQNRTRLVGQNNNVV
ncbi:unnamed protein product [Adineta ricciae]|uniref:BEN domain-containing protein n=1 Tax=Adineta ricciae TaxID=249248 RepID=A0A816FUF7_ADIRI|nr:unnamed protein product [Adineta ricciae]